MALQLTRLRRALTSLPTLHRSLSSPIITPTSPPLPLSQNPIESYLNSPLIFSHFQTRLFRVSGPSLSSSKKEYRVYKEGDEITEDMVLFEGCDFNHWLITVDFPKDPAPTPQEMVATYERICAEGLRISIEEAKTKIYACSTTTYQGFQAVMTEEESEKFKDINGVVFVLPDSYIDPQNKQYGGDLYENGVITHRPPPIQYKRGGGRFRDGGNRNPEPRRYPMPNQSGSSQNNQQGPPPQNNGPPRYPPQQNYGPPAQQNYGPPQNYPQQQNYGPPQNHQPQQNYGPPQNQPPQNYGPPQNQPPHQNYGPPKNQPPHQNYGPPQNQPPHQSYGPPGQWERTPMNSGNHEANRGPYQTNQYTENPRGFAQGGQRDFMRENQNFSLSQTGANGQGTTNAGYGQVHSGEGQRFSQMEQRNTQGEQANYAPAGQSEANRGRF
ncbi:multiple organellar RNA editing factor 1, mitochondrial [Mercurialis annua]|uniref:multiple organellar RNA editing factor 1, mitochondrial n=1 Tax=Mercurialis annua TaxID=3986 RepID=UPI00215EFCFA|nr:multiple organellar RNA editing factor 1, mitochondrial [Mercurialis annua]